MEPNYCITKTRTLSEPNIEILAICWNSDDSLLATGCSDGGIRVYSSVTWGLHKFLSLRVASSMPVTSLTWRPEGPETEQKNVLLSTSSDGWVAHWIASSATVLDSFRVQGEQLLASDYSTDAAQFAVGRKDFTVGVYDAHSMTLTTCLEAATGDIPGHSNRIFALKWVSENVLLSGGWDNTVIAWDVRERSVRGTMFGPHICGHAIDLYGDNVLAGSYDRSEQVQVFSMASYSKVHSMNLGTSERPCMLYACGYCKLGGGVFATVGHDTRVFDSASYEELFIEKGEGEGYCCNWANTENTLAVGTSDGLVKLYSVNK